MAVLVTRANLPAAPTGLAATAVHGWIKCYNEESGVLVDRTTEFITVANDVESFAADDDYVYFSIDSTVPDDRVVHIHLVLSQVASTDILPVFEYSTGDDSWAALAVTDGTNGFTQNGSIIVNLTTFPTYQVWLAATKDGSGNTVGDGNARRYIRIKRTVDSLATPPQISECGSGLLTASKTYYYRASTTKILDNSFQSHSNKSRNMSAPSAEFSATTTTVKRTIKIDIDTGGNSYIVWRTPTSGNYDQTHIHVGSAYLDEELQTVKGVGYTEASGTGGADSSLIDNGIPSIAAYSAAYGLYKHYNFAMYTGKERAELTVDTTDGSVAKFHDIWLECQAQGWTDALVRHHYSYSPGVNQRREVFELNDNLDIRGDFKDSGVTLLMTAVLQTWNSTSVIFGRILGSSPNYYYDSGVDLILTQMISYSGRFYFKNTKFYSCKFIQACILSVRIYAHFPVIDDSCELYDCMLDGYSSFEKPSFEGDNIVLDNVLVSKTRYGLSIHPDAMDTISMTDLVIQSGTGLYNAPPYWQEGDEFTFTNFKFVGVTRFLVSYSGTSNDSNVTLNFVNPILLDTVITSARGGQYWLYNEQYTFDLKVIDVDGEIIEGANVVIKDSEGTELFNGNTDGNGEIVQQILTYKQYTGGTLASESYRQYIPDDITTYDPHTITITKADYLSRTIPYTMDRKREEIEMLDEIPVIRTANAKGSIKQTQSSIVNSKARIYILPVQTIDAKANIKSLNEQSLLSGGNIKKTHIKLLEVKSRIHKSGVFWPTTQTLEVKANILQAGYRRISRIKVIDIVDMDDKMRTRAVPRVRPRVKEIMDYGRISRIKWITAKAKIQ